MSSIISRIKALASVLVLLALWSPSALAIYDSGYDPAASLGDYVADGTNNTIVLPETGVLHYDSFTVPAGEIVNFVKNADNTGVWILCGGDVLIEGTIDISGKTAVFNGSVLDAIDYIGGLGGPGASDGGLRLDGAYVHPSSPEDLSGKLNGWGPYIQSGLGPAGGGRVHDGGSPLRLGNDGFNQDPQEHAAWGEPGWVHLSGGGGSGAWRWNSQTNSSGGGGLLTIGSNTSITVNGTIDASANNSLYGGGGIVRLIADTVGGTGTVDVRSNNSSIASASGYGALKMEALFFEGTLANNTLPNGADPLLAAPGVALPYPEDERPRLEIVSVNGAGPQGSVGSWPPNVLLTTGVSIDVVVKGQYMPVGQSGLVVQVNCGGIDPIQYTDAVLEGSFEESFATVSITIPIGSAAGHVEAWWVEPMEISAAGI